MLSHNLNLCNCFNNLAAYQHTIDKSDFSLKLRKDHPKVFYYRAIAYINLNKLEEAEADYYKLTELMSSSDPGLQNLRKLIDEKKPKTEETGSKKIFKSMFKSGVYQDREKDKSHKRKNSEDEEEN
jgi:hypothetical protein